MSSTLDAGVSRRIINARVGSPKFGIRLFADPIQGYESDLTATALVLANSHTKLAIIALDICELFNPLSNQIRQEAADLLGVPRSHVMINLSHDHSTPSPPNSTRDSAERKRFADIFGKELKGHILAAVAEADRAKQPVRIGAGAGEAQVGIYRRETGAGRARCIGRGPRATHRS